MAQVQELQPSVMPTVFMYGTKLENKLVGDQ